MKVTRASTKLIIMVEVRAMTRARASPKTIIMRQRKIMRLRPLQALASLVIYYLIS